MPAYTLAQLETMQLSSAIAARLTAALAAAVLPDGTSLPVAAWAPSSLGGLEMSVVEMVAGGLASIVGPKLVDIVEGRFLDLAEGAWLTEYAWQRYRFRRGAATYAIQNVKLTSTVGATFEAGDLWVGGPGENRYVSIERVVLVAGVAQNIQFQAENPGSSYADVAGTVTTMITAPAGLTAVNERPTDFEATQVSGASTGTVTAAFFNPLHPPTFPSVLVRITAFGDLGTARFIISIDGGATWSDETTVPEDSDLDTPDHLTIGPTWVLIGPTNPPIPRYTGSYVEALAAITFRNGTSPSFIQGTVFTMLVGDAIAQHGADEESDASLRERCRGRWASLSDVPTESLVRLWCRLADPEIVRVTVTADPNLPGGFITTIASGSGGASAAAQLAVRNYIHARLRGYVGSPGPTDPTIGGSAQESVTVNSARLLPIAAAGIVSVPRDIVAEVQQEADRLWSLYLGGLDIGGMVRASELVQAIMDAGAIDAQPLLTGGSPNIQLDADQVAVVADGTSLTTSLTWRPV